MVIEQLKKKAWKGKLSDKDYEALKIFMELSIYNKQDYQNGYQRIEDQRILLNIMVSKLAESKRNWDFKLFEEYEVKLTLFGPGGSYDPMQGSISILTTKEGGFKQHPNPANNLSSVLFRVQNTCKQ